ncbi:MAG: hypothetical protein AB7Q37_18490 [Pyrinomonadaceae bacterium]
MSDISERLRTRYECTAGFTRDIFAPEDRDLDIEAADEIERLRQLIADHNAGCQSRCGVGEQEAVACGYRPYFERNGRRCTHCPVYEMIADRQITSRAPCRET